MEEFKLKAGEDYIQLNDLLKVMSWVASGGEAKQFILNEDVHVNQNPELRIRRKLRAGDTVQFNGNEVVVKA
ncbi:MAG: RNA-binding S4 domain-containing protein [Cyclobacteriaceae bacterium]